MFENGETSICDAEGIGHSTRYWTSGTTLRAAVGLTCILSMLGTVLIIISYVFYKNLRNRARLILVHLSIVDFGVALSNFIGSMLHFDQYYVTYNDTCISYHWPQHSYIKNLCETQAFFSHYFTLGSVLWTMSLAVYLYFLLMHSQTSLAPISLVVSYFLCYGLPISICLWLSFTDMFGYSAQSFSWCALLAYNDVTGESHIFAALFGYDLWVYLAMVVILILYLTVQLFLREKLKQSRKYLRDGEERFREALMILDYRFFLIPLMFAMLRMWTCIAFILEVCVHVKDVPIAATIILRYLSSIGDSAQGFVNAILFVIFTKKVRITVFNIKYWRRKIQKASDEESRILNGVQPCAVNSPKPHSQNQTLNDRQRLTGNSEIFTPITATLSYTNI